MILANKENNADIMALIPSIKENMSEWQIINVNMRKNSMLSTDDVLQRLYLTYKNLDGATYAVKERRIVCMVRLGITNNYAKIKTDLEKVIPGQSFRILVRKMNPMGLQQVQTDLMGKSDGSSMCMFSEREERQKNMLMVADDDMFVRKAMNTALGPYGDVVEADSGDKVVAQYIKHNPDMILLDIHMPGENGLDVVDKLMEVDPNAFIIVFSADSVAENVLKAIEKGSAGFVSKPPQKEKIVNYMKQCLTIQ